MNIENKIKKLIWQSNHMGMVENDLLLGEFAKKNLHYLDIKLIHEFEYLLQNINDNDLFNWTTKKQKPSKNCKNIISKIIEFKENDFTDN